MTTSWTARTGVTSSWGERNPVSSSWEKERQEYYLLKQDGFFLLLEDGYKIELETKSINNTAWSVRLPI